MIQLLLNHKDINLNMRDMSGKTALYYVFHNTLGQKEEIFKMFLLTNKLDFEINKVKELIGNNIEYNNIFKLNKNLPTTIFYNFDNNESDLNFVYANNTNKRKFY